jgi:hypothetical protein
LKNPILTIPILLLAASLVTAVPPVVGANLNLLYISPPAQGPFAAGSTVTYQIKVAQFDAFNTWDIMVRTDPTAINPVDFSITPNALTANFSVTELELTHCVNGVGSGCNAAAGDGAGVIHSAVLPLGSPPVGAVINGVILTITYTAGATTMSTVNIFNELIANAGIAISHTTQQGTYGNIVAQDFTISASPTNPTIAAPPGGTVVSVISLKSVGPFTGSVNVTASIAPPSFLVTPTLDTAVVSLATGSGTSNLNIAVASNATAGSYSITVTGSGIVQGHLTSHSVLVTLTVSTTVADFEIALNPNPLATILASYSTTSTVTVTSLNGFAGTVTLSAVTLVNKPNVPLASLSSNTVTISAGGSASVKMTLQSFALTPVPAPTPSGIYDLLVTGASGAEIHTAVGSVNVQPAVFLRHLGWTHHLLFTKTAGVQTFDARVQNNATSPVVAQVVVLVRCGTFRAFARSDPAGTTLPGGNVTANIAGPVVHIAVSLTLPNTTIGDECTVRGALFYGGSSNPTTLTKVTIRRNTFTTNIVNPLIAINGKIKTGPSKSLALQFEQTLTGKFFVLP